MAENPELEKLDFDASKYWPIGSGYNMMLIIEKHENNGSVTNRDDN